MKPYEREQAVAIEAVRNASFLCRAVQSDIASGVLDKADRSPVTIADFASQALVCRALMQHFPDDPVVGEEDAASLRRPENAALLQRVVEQIRSHTAAATDVDTCTWIDHGNTGRHEPRFWTLDPVDGTRGLIRGDQYAVVLALVVRGRVEVGIIGCPNLPHPATGSRGVLFVAVRDQGAAALELDDPSGKAFPLSVSPESNVAEASFCESFEAIHSSHDHARTLTRAVGITAPPVRVDSQVKYALVASSQTEMYLRIPRRPGHCENIWDHAAGTLVVTEAGGRVTDLDGKDLDFAVGPKLRANRGVLVTNGTMHETMIDALRADQP